MILASQGDALQGLARTVVLDKNKQVWYIELVLSILPRGDEEEWYHYQSVEFLQEPK